MFAQNVGGKGDTELSREDVTFRWREVSVESFGHLSVYWKLDVIPARVLVR